MSDTGSMTWFLATTIGFITILAGFVLAASRAAARRGTRWHSKWPTGPWP